MEEAEAGRRVSGCKIGSYDLRDLRGVWVLGFGLLFCRIGVDRASCGRDVLGHVV